MGQSFFSMRSLRHVGTEVHQRIAGWFLLTVGILGLLTDLNSLNSVNVPYLIMLAGGMWLLARNLHLFDEGETATLLRTQHYHEHQKPKLHARYHHVQQHITAQKAQEIISTLRVFLLVVGAIALSVSTVLLWQYEPIGFLFFLALASMVLVVLAFHNRSTIWLLVGTLFTLVSILQASATSLQTADYQDALFVAFATIPVVIFLIITYYQQTHQYRRFIGGILGLASASYLVTWLQFPSLPLATSFEVGLISLSLLSALMALFSWARRQRISYAKYFLLISLSALFMYVYLFWSSTAVTLLWLTAALASLVVGFMIPSYSARMLGLACLSVAVLYYLLVVIPDPLTVSGPLWTQAQVWVGISLLISLGVSYWWYGFIDAKSKEKMLLPAIKSFFIASGSAAIFSLLLVESTSMAERGILSCLGAVILFLGAKMYKSSSALLCGFILCLYALLEIGLSIGNATDGMRLLMFLSLVILLVPGTFLIYQRR